VQTGSLDPADKRRLGLFLVVLALIVGWDLPILLPLRILVVVFHEAGHALMTLATGGEVLAVSVSPDEGGLTMSRGGSRLLILNGGYLGSIAAGVVLLRLARSDGRGRPMLALLGLVLVGAALVWFRPILSFGFFYALLGGALLVLLAARVRHQVADWIVRTVGLFSLLYGLLDVKSDVLDHGLQAGAVRSDAAMLAEATGVPALVWGLGWVVVGLLLVLRLRRHIF